MAIGLLYSIVPFTMLAGLLSFFGPEVATVTWGGGPLTGFPALIVSPLVGLFLGLLFAAILGTMIAFGLWLYSKVGPLQIRVLGVKNGGND